MLRCTCRTQKTHDNTTRQVNFRADFLLRQEGAHTTKMAAFVNIASNVFGRRVARRYHSPRAPFSLCVRVGMAVRARTARFGAFALRIGSFAVYRSGAEHDTSQELSVWARLKLLLLVLREEGCVLHNLHHHKMLSCASSEHLTHLFLTSYFLIKKCCSVLLARTVDAASWQAGP